MNRDLDDVLQLVASGELTPAEALELLDETPDETLPPPPLYVAATPRSGPVDRRPVSDAVGPITEVRLHTPYRAVHVIGDPTVSELVVSGAHSLRRDGHAAIIENPIEGRPPDGRFTFSSLPWGLAFSKGARDKLIVRVNPMVHVCADLTANDFRVSGCDAGLQVKMIAGSLKLDRVRGPLMVDASTSSVKGIVGISGDSNIRAEQSSVALALLAGTDLRVHARNRMSKIMLPGSISKGGITEGEISDSTIGSGRDLLDIDALMSSVKVSVEW